MTANTYDKGDMIRVQATFTVASVATDPTTITLKVNKPRITTVPPVQELSITQFPLPSTEQSQLVVIE